VSAVNQFRAACRAGGFTLIEVLVALVIVSLGMMAVKTQLDRYVLTAQFMEDTTLASWIGTNKIVELSTLQAWPEVGESDEEIEFAGRMWRLEIEVSQTEVDNLRRVDVDVSHLETPETMLQRVSGLVEPPAPQGFVPVSWLNGAQGGSP